MNNSEKKFKSRSSWREKLDRVQEWHISPIPVRMQKRHGQGSMLIPRPLDVEALIFQVPKGKLITQTQIRKALAQARDADVTCPMTTGIFVRIVAEAAEEAASQGSKRIAPYWRVVRDDGGLIEKFPGGTQAQAERLRGEGHQVVEGKKARVRLSEDLLAELDCAVLA